tara:strand:+ start:336 stop:563 length:228 start_codon:yes stop_codon:yes gene_type:complete
MGRTNQQKLCYSCIVIVGDYVLHEEEYKTLRDIAIALDLTYQQVADINSNRKNKFQNGFKYQPDIQIKKLCEIEV